MPTPSNKEECNLELHYRENSLVAKVLLPRQENRRL